MADDSLITATYAICTPERHCSGVRHFGGATQDDVRPGID